MLFFKQTKLQNEKKTFKKIRIHTCLSQVMVGTGFPDAVHSKLTSVPFLTTMFPSSGFGLILGGTGKFER